MFAAKPGMACRCGLMLLLALGLPLAAEGAIRLGTIGDLDFGVWDGLSGDLELSADFCVLSTARNGRVTDYDFLARALGRRVFALKPASGGAADVPVQVTFTDLTAGAEEALEPWVWMGPKTGMDGCTGVNNARITARLSALDLAAAMPGVYELRVLAMARNQSPDNGFFSIRVTIPDRMLVSGLDDIALGDFDGTTDLSGVDGLCVYRGGGGDYQILTAGDGPAGAYQVAGAAAVVPYAVEYDDGGGYRPMASGVPIVASGASGVAFDCGGASNGSVRVTVLAADLGSVVPDSYAGTLTVTVAAQ